MRTGHDDLFISSYVAEKSASLRGVIIKMINSGSIPENITFTGAQTSNDVFGNGQTDVPNLTLPSNTCEPMCSKWNSPPVWKFLPAAKKDNGWYVYGVGTTATDIVAYLPGVTSAVCAELQKGLGYKSSVPPQQAVAPFDPEKPGVYSATGGPTTIKSEDGTLDGQEAGCFDNHVGAGPSNFSYYFVLYKQ